MTLETYIQKLTKLVEDNPAALQYTVINSIDAEGNGYEEIYYDPSVGVYEDDEFIGEDLLEDYEREAGGINSVCVN